MDISVTVVIPVYNGELLIGRCLESVLRQSIHCGIEVLVIDDGSTDRTVEVINGFEDNRIRVIAQQKRGPAAARNAGLERASGTYLAFLDADDYWETGFLEKTVDFLDTHSEVVAVSVGQIHKLLSRPAVIVPRFLQNRSLSLKSQVLDSFFDFWAKHNHVCTGSVLMRTDVAKMTGGQRPELRSCEDLEFWGYLATQGKWGFIPQVLFVSDGEYAAGHNGWLEKHQSRWTTCPTTDEWERRLVPRLGSQDWPGFRIVRGRVAESLAFCHILGGRPGQARVEVKKYGSEFPPDRMSRLLLTADATGAIGWCLCSQLLRFRERLKSLAMRVASRGALPCCETLRGCSAIT